MSNDQSSAPVIWEQKFRHHLSHPTERWLVRI